jgi:hypothetical protein
MKSFQQFIKEKAPPGKKAEDWIKSNKQRFKDQYGNDWEQVLYAKAWKLFGEDIEEIDLGLTSLIESMAASTSTNGVANPDSKPIFKKSTEFGHPCLEVDSNTYSKCMQGKIPFKRWKNYAESDIENELKKMYHKTKRMLIKDSRTGSMIFIK